MALEIAHVAAQCGVEAAAVDLAVRVKVAAMVTGWPPLAGSDSWRDLILRAGSAEGRAEAEQAWAAVEAQPHVDAGRVADYAQTALRYLAEAPDDAHYRRSLLPVEEIRTLREEFAGPVRPLPERRFHELFEERVRRHPEAVAAVQAERSWTYAELNRRANRVAHSLYRRGLAAEDVVAVVADRSLEWLAAVLAVFKAGGCYLPVEPHFPAERMALMVERSGCRWVLADPATPNLDRALAGRDGVEVSRLDVLIGADGPDEDLGVPVTADQLAYLYFTSGSTGEPKGALCRHDGFLNHLLAKIEDLGVREGGVVAQTAPQCFDISLWQSVAALLVGGRTHVIGQEAVLDVRRFVGELDAGEVEVLQIVPSYLEVLLTELAERPVALPALRCVSATGEALKKGLVERWFAAFPEVALVNAYGLTETSDDTNHEVMRGVPQEAAVPLGRAVRNVLVEVVDERLEPVPLGAPGEIVFSGVCVGAGYVNDPERTAAAFVEDPRNPGRRMYRSGDFGRWLPSGKLEFLGRRDSQVKVAGFRIEIGEIENALLRVAGVRDAAVVVAGSTEQPQLVGFYTGAEAPGPEVAAEELRRLLPGYLLPQRLTHRPSLPVTANGKTDKRALLQIAAEVDVAEEAAADDAPTTETERRVAGLWARVLKIPAARVGRSSRFTELGGTSLAAIRLAIALDRAVSVGELAETPTVADVAALLDRKLALHGGVSEIESEGAR